ncbi:MAG: hypothetical protein KGL68_11080 [Burkholderiales bacterium]|nr:hypothetical protein [Burkholderiales bacterium]
MARSTAGRVGMRPTRTAGGRSVTCISATTLRWRDRFATFGPAQFLWAGMFILFVSLEFRAAGIYPVVFADEWSYSSFARLLPLRDASVPSYLYLGLFKSTLICGDGFLECARTINNALIVLTVPLIYLVARRVCASWPAAFIALFSVAGAFDTYTIYFMPETMYFAGFWLLTLAALSSRLSSPSRYGLCVGALLGALSLVKVHALFLLPGLALLGAYRQWAGRRTDWLRSAVKSMALTATAFSVVKLGMGFLLAGSHGVTVFGSLYGAQAGGVVHGKPYGQVALDAMRNLTGHVMALALMFGVPLAALLSLRWRSGNDDLGEGKAAPQLIAVYTLIVLLPLLAVVGYFTASVAGTGPYESLSRLHMRYYNFAFPLLLVIAASQSESAKNFALRRAVYAVVVGSIAGYGLHELLRTFSPSMVDSPELRGLTLSPTLYLVLGIAGILATLVWSFNTRWAVGMFVFALLPLMALTSNWQVSSEVRKRQLADVYDEAGLFTKRYLGPSASHLTVIAPDPAALLRTLFHIDNADVKSMQLAPGSHIDVDHLPAGTEWLLLIGDYQLPSPYHSGMAAGKFRLVRTAQDYTVDFRRASWPGVLAYSQGLSTPEPWGTWSLGREITLEFADDLPLRFQILLQGHSFGINDNADFRIQVGVQERTFRLPSDQDGYVSLEFAPGANQRVVRITIPHPLSPKSVGQGDDLRELGLGLIQLRITPMRPAQSS